MTLPHKINPQELHLCQIGYSRCPSTILHSYENRKSCGLVYKIRFSASIIVLELLKEYNVLIATARYEIKDVCRDRAPNLTWLMGLDASSTSFLLSF